MSFPTWKEALFVEGIRLKCLIQNFLNPTRLESLETSCYSKSLQAEIGYGRNEGNSSQALLVMEITIYILKYFDEMFQTVLDVQVFGCLAASKILSLCPEGSTISL